MVEELNFLAAHFLLAGFGLPAAFAPGMRRASVGVRFALAFMAGAVALTVWGTILSTVGVAWSMASVVLPLGLGSMAGSLVVSRKGSAGEGPATWSGWDALGLAVGGGAVAHLVLMAATSRATSIDFFYFWGVKAIEFAEAGGIDAEMLTAHFSVHLHVPYPPLVPLVGAWGVELAGGLPWRAGLVTMAIWIALAYPVVIRGLRSRLPIAEATLASGVWMLGVSLAVAASFSAGNGEPPLLFFATVAIVALIASEDAFPNWVAPLATCGIVLTKSEGVVLWILLVAGFALRDLLDRRTIIDILRRLSGMVVAPALALSTWMAFELRHGIPFGDAAREAAGVISFGNLVPALIESVRYLEAGSGWLAWGLATVVMGLSWRGWRDVLPALSVTTGVLAFLLIYYLHYQGDTLGVWVSWTLPRVSLTALSAALLAAAVASGRGAPEESQTR